MSDSRSTGHFGIVAGCTHIVTLLGRNGEPRRRWRLILKWMFSNTNKLHYLFTDKTHSKIRTFSPLNYY